MFFKPLRKLYCLANFWINTAIIVLVPGQVISNVLPQYPFEKSQQVLIADSLLKDGLYKSAIEFYRLASDGYREVLNWEGVVYALNKLVWAETADFHEEEGYDILKQSSKIIIERNLSESILIAIFMLKSSACEERVSIVPTDILSTPSLA